MDALKLKQFAKDQLHPLLSELMSSYTRFKDSENWEGRPRLLHWLIELNKMRASEEISEDQSRQVRGSFSRLFTFVSIDYRLTWPWNVQMFFDIEHAYSEFVSLLFFHFPI